MPAATVPELVLKKRRTSEAITARRVNHLKKVAAKRRVSRKAAFKNAEKYTKEYRSKERELVRLRRQAKRAGNFYVEAEPKVALVIRIRGINAMAPQTRKILQLLRLRQIHNATFVKLNKATIQMLRRVEPYITYGYPNLKTVRDLVLKRGFAKVNGQRMPITSNAIIEENLGKKGIICVEDLIHEIYTCGPNFKWANRFLWPIKLSSPKGGFNRKAIHYQEGGDAGNREDQINKLVRRMN